MILYFLHIIAFSDDKRSVTHAATSLNLRGIIFQHVALQRDGERETVFNAALTSAKNVSQAVTT